jgi:hypothetical protein
MKWPSIEQQNDWFKVVSELVAFHLPSLVSVEIQRDQQQQQQRQQQQSQSHPLEIASISIQSDLYLQSIQNWNPPELQKIIELKAEREKQQRQSQEQIQQLSGSSMSLGVSTDPNLLERMGKLEFFRRLGFISQLNGQFISRKAAAQNNMPTLLFPAGRALSNNNNNYESKRLDTGTLINRSGVSSTAVVESAVTSGIVLTPDAAAMASRLDAAAGRGNYSSVVETELLRALDEEMDDDSSSGAGAGDTESKTTTSSSTDPDDIGRIFAPITMVTMMYELESCWYAIQLQEHIYKTAACRVETDPFAANSIKPFIHAGQRKKLSDWLISQCAVKSGDDSWDRTFREKVFEAYLPISSRIQARRGFSASNNESTHFIPEDSEDKFDTPFLRKVRATAQATVLFQSEMGIKLGTTLDTLTDSQRQDMISDANHPLHAIFLLLFFSHVLFHHTSATVDIASMYYIPAYALEERYRDVLLKSKSAGVPRRPVICWLRRQWMVHVYVKPNEPAVWIQCADVEEAILTWMALVNGLYGCELENRCVRLYEAMERLLIVNK